MVSASKIHPPIWKLAVLALFFGTIVVVASINLFPQVPLIVALLYAAAGIVAFFAIVSVSIIVSSRINAWVLNKGGTDTQWLWFKSDPQGAVRLRESARMDGDDAVQELEPTIRHRGP